MAKNNILSVHSSTVLRVASLDATRGFLLVLITFTHAYGMVRGLQTPELWYEISGLNNIFKFDIIRFIGHPVATSFVLCMGISMALLHYNKTNAGWTEKKIIELLIRRAVLLIILQFSIVNTIWALSGDSITWSDLSFLSILSLYKDYNNYFGILFMLGSCLFITAFFLRTSLVFLIVAGLIIIISPYFYLSFISSPIDTYWWLGPLAIPGGWRGIWVLYPVIPWLGITFIGVAIGKFLLERADLFLKYRGQIACYSALIFMAYIFLKLLIGINDPVKALNIVRYPPEIFLLFLGISLLICLMIVFEKIHNSYLVRILNVFGQCRVFFYVLHLFFSMLFSALVVNYNFYISIPLVFICNISTMVILCLIYRKYIYSIEIS